MRSQTLLFLFFFLQEQKSHGSNLIEIFKKLKFFKTVTPLHVIRNISLLENNHRISIFILIVHYKILFLISIFSTSIITKYRYTFILSYNLRTESYLKETWNEEISKKEIKKKGRKNFFFPLDSRTSSIFVEMIKIERLSRYTRRK